MQRGKKAVTTTSASQQSHQLSQSQSSTTTARTVEGGFTPEVLSDLLSQVMGSSSSGSRNVASSSERELNECRKKLKDAIATSERVSMEKERLVIQYDAEVSASKAAEEALRARVEKLEKDRKYLYHKEKEAQAKVKSMESEMSKLKQAHVKEIGEYVMAKSNLENQMRTLKSELEASRASTAQRTLEEAQRSAAQLEQALVQARQFAAENAERARNAQMELEHAEEKMQKMEIQLEETERKGKRRRIGAANDANQDGSMIMGSDSEDDIHRTLSMVSRQLNEQIVTAKKLESQVWRQKEEIRFLKLEREETERHREMYMEARAKLKDATRIKEQYEALLVEHAFLQKERADWTAYISEDNADDAKKELNTPHKLGRELASARIDVQLALERAGRLQSEVNTLHAELERAENEIQGFTRIKRELDAQQTSDARQIAKLTRSNAVLKDELTYLRRQLDAFVSEDTGMRESDFAWRVRVEELEKLLEQYRELAISVQNPVHSSNEPQVAEDIVDSRKELANKLRQIESEAEELKRDKMNMEKEMLSLERQLVVMEHALGRGEYDRSKIKILQLKDNPSSQAQGIRESKLLALKNENQALLARLESLRLNGSNADGSISDMSTPTHLIPVQTLDNLRNENQQLVQKIAEIEKRLLRLKQVFQAKAIEFREAVYSLLGYRLDILANGRVRLTSGYAPTSDASFIFSSGEGDEGTMQLVGGGNDAFVANLEELIQDWVITRGSIPGFLAELTLRLIDEQGVDGMRDMEFDDE